MLIYLIYSPFAGGFDDIDVDFAVFNCLTNYSTSQSQGGVGGDEEVGLGSGRGAGRADVEELLRAARRLGSCEPPAAPGSELSP